MVQTMSGITLVQAQAQLDGLLAAQMSQMLSVSIGGRTVTYRSLKEISDAIAQWSRIVAQLQRVAGGGSRHGYAAADFRSTR
jgi:hypothetical protein